MPNEDYFIRSGDHGETIHSVCEDSTGAAVNISGATVKFVLQPIGGGALKLNATASNDDVGVSTRGNVSYTWQAADTDTPGLYLAYWRVTLGGGAVQTFPNGGYVLVRVTSALVAA